MGESDPEAPLETEFWLAAGDVRGGGIGALPLETEFWLAAGDVRGGGRGALEAEKMNTSLFWGKNPKLSHC